MNEKCDVVDLWCRKHIRRAELCKAYKDGFQAGKKKGREEVHCKNCGWPKDHTPHGWSPEVARSQAFQECGCKKCLKALSN